MNPELRRNLWLELTLHRLVAVPVALGLILALVYKMGEPDPFQPMAVTAVSLFIAFALWGGVQAGDAVHGEVRARTWDGQRMSAIEPWSMTWGKLAGAPAFAWYGGALCLAAYLAVSPERTAPKMALFLAAGMVLLASIALVGSIVAGRKAVVRSPSSAWVLGIVLLFVGPWMSVLSASEADIAWWGRSWARLDFLLASTIVFAAWSVFGAHRLMSQELRVRTTPWAWVAFLLFVSAYIAGFGIRYHDTPGQKVNVVVIAGLVVSMATIYPLLFSEASGAMAVRRLLLRVAARDRRRLLEETPLWPVSLALAIVFCLLTVTLVGPRGSEEGFFRGVVLAPVPLVLLAVRDAALYMFFALARQPRRAEAATIFYLLLLYWLVPMLLRAAGAQGLSDLVLPPFWARPGFAAAVAAVQAGIVIAAALWRWRKNYGS
ncbi:MAG: hypothetical protein JSS40_06175 [Proteobacteria bacterium]|nr:hypothetical protein [Pseudomonadota bacterium]